MKLAPIRNPHSKTAKVEKKSKQEEKDELIEKTKLDAIEKYGKRGPGKKTLTGAAMAATGGEKGDKGDFQLEEKVTQDSEAIKLLQQGYLQSYIDFFYLTNETTPSVITPSDKLLEEYKLDRRKKQHLHFNEENLQALSADLVDAEQFLRDGNVKKSLELYRRVSKIYEGLEDYETASYFYNRCLEISKEAKYVDGEALAYTGLGICEEKVLNIFESMRYHETALEKAIDGGLSKIERTIS